MFDSRGLSEIKSPDGRSFGRLGCRSGADLGLEFTIGGDTIPHQMADARSIVG